MVREKSHRVDDFFLGSKLSEYFESARLENFSRYRRIWKLTIIINTRKNKINLRISVDILPSIVYIIIKEREIQKGEKTMKTNENKGLTFEELKKVVELLHKAEEENIEILEGLESLIHSMVTLKRLQSKN